VKKSIKKYILKKLKTFTCPEDIPLYFEYAVRLWAEKYDYQFLNFCQDPTDGEYLDIDDIHRGYSLPYRVQGDLEPKKGNYIHIANKIKTIDDIRHTIDCKGEICCSDFEDCYLIYNSHPIAFIFEATPTESYSYDCYSYISKTGKRLAGCIAGNSRRNEHFVIPLESRLKAVGIGVNNRFYKEIQRLSIEIGFDIYPISVFTEADNAID